MAIDETPKWFEAFEKRNDAHWEKQEKFNDMVIKRLDGIDVRLDGIDERIDGIEKRLDGIVNSNELKDPNNE